jgi:hypothetical protein
LNFIAPPSIARRPPDDRAPAASDAIFPQVGNRIGQRRRVAGIDDTHVCGRAIDGQSLGEVFQWAAAAPSQPQGQAAGGQLGCDELAAVARCPKQQHIAGHLTVSGKADLGCCRHSTPLLR